MSRADGRLIWFKGPGGMGSRPPAGAGVKDIWRERTRRGERKAIGLFNGCPPKAASFLKGPTGAAASVRGFSLLEVMIALAILAVSLLALFNLQGTSLRGAARAQRIAVATHLAQRKMAEVMLDLKAGLLKGEFPDEKEEEGVFEEEDYFDFTWKLRIRKTELPAISAPEGQSEILGQVFAQVAEELARLSREVTLTVSWIEMGEEQEGLTVTTHLVNL